MNSPRTFVLSVVLGLLFTSSALFAHQDRIIRLEGTKLVGLPPEYSPAQLDLKNSLFRIKNHQMHFGQYLQAFFDDSKDAELKITASWYHDTTTLPPYIDLHFHPVKKDYSYEFLFSLDTLELIEATVVIQTAPDSTRDFPIALSDLQKKDIRDSISTIK